MSGSTSAQGDILSAPFKIEYDYRRSLGSVLGHFFTQLRDRQITGIKTAAGRVLCPPAEYDPENGVSTTGDFVNVGPGGVVESWTWIANPRKQHLLQEPFAFALIKLDGADTALLHAVKVPAESDMSTGMRVAVQWAEETVGHIHDIASFVPEG